jgi:hypothetical protein
LPGAKGPTSDTSPRPSEHYAVAITQTLLPTVVRNAIAELLRSQPTPTLSITGPRQSPVDEVLRFVQQVGTPDFERTIVDVAEWRRDYSGRDLAGRIAVSAGLSVEKMPGIEGTTARSLRDLATWLVSTLDAKGVPRLLAIRGSEQDAARPDALDLVSQLIAQIAQSNGQLRLLLLNYNAPVPSAIEPRVRRLTLEPVNRSDVQRFFTRVFEQTGRTVELAVVEQVTDRVFAELASVDSWAYEDLRNRLATAAEALIQA